MFPDFPEQKWPGGHVPIPSCCCVLNGEASPRAMPDLPNRLYHGLGTVVNGGYDVIRIWGLVVLYYYHRGTEDTEKREWEMWSVSLFMRFGVGMVEEFSFLLSFIPCFISSTTEFRAIRNGGTFPSETHRPRASPVRASPAVGRANSLHIYRGGRCSPGGGWQWGKGRRKGYRGGETGRETRCMRGIRVMRCIENRKTHYFDLMGNGEEMIRECTRMDANEGQWTRWTRWTWGGKEE